MVEPKHANQYSCFLYDKTEVITHYHKVPIRNYIFHVYIVIIIKVFCIVERKKLVHKKVYTPSTGRNCI